VSKAFTRESDDAPEAPVLPPLRSALPPGAKNYLTTDGAQRLRTELDALMKQRLELTSAPGTPESKSALQSLDQRIFRLQQSLESAVITPAPPRPWEQVRFGATVSVRNERGEESEYRIVGVDETDVGRGWVSWLSPIAKALLNARLGQKVRFKFPDGETQLEITRITFD
jgi:transcription elongation factor GreB